MKDTPNGTHPLVAAYIILTIGVSTAFTLTLGFEGIIIGIGASAIATAILYGVGLILYRILPFLIIGCVFGVARLAARLPTTRDTTNDSANSNPTSN